MSAQDQNPDERILHYEQGIAIFNTRVDDMQREVAESKARDKEYKDEQLILNRKQVAINKRLMWFTAALVFVGAVGGGISMYQARVSKINAEAARDNAEAAKGMVAEMKTTGADTHNLAIAARDQAKAVADQLAAFEDAQAGYLTVEEYVRPHLPQVNDPGSFRIYNRGNTVVRITEYAKQGASPGGSWVNDLSEIEKDLKIKRAADPNGFTIQPGGHKEYSFYSPSLSNTFYEWFRWDYLDVFGNHQTLTACYEFFGLHGGTWVPCFSIDNRRLHKSR